MQTTNAFLLVLVIAVLSCNNKQTAANRRTIYPPEFSDPYLEAFRGKNIKFIVSEPPLSDTIEFDRRGNLVRIKKYGQEEKRAYDSNNFLIRRWIRSDFTKQYTVRYSNHGDTLIQIWRELNSNDWILRNDTTSFPHEVDHFVFDKSGRIIQEFDDGFGPVRYVYSHGKLSRKEAEVRRNNEDEVHLEVIADYAYSTNGQLQRFTLQELDSRDVERRFFFLNGLLDSSSVTSVKGDGIRLQQYRHRYVYY
ncbi:MAG: hypothetical protein QM762_13895 [Chryseolinea sp.]